jgi:hypothetical protein
VTVLEQRYRRLLTLLPTGYRHAWEEDMVETYLSLADDEKPRRRVRVAEAWAVMSLALRLRLSGRSESAVEWRQAVRYLVLAILVIQFASAALLVQSQLDLLGHSQGHEFGYLPDLLVHASGVLLFGTAFLAVLWSKTSLALGLAALIAVREVALVWTAQLFWGLPTPGHYLPGDAPYALLAALVVGGVFVLHRTQTPPTRRSGWLVAMPLTVVALSLFGQLPDEIPVNEADIWASGVAVIMLLNLRRPVPRWVNVTPVLAGIAIAAVVCSNSSLLAYRSQLGPTLTRFVVWAAILIALSVALRLRVRKIRRRAAVAS